MANKYQPHVFLIPEDDANREVALALLLELDIDPAKYKLFLAARGWPHVVESFLRDHVNGMNRFQQRYLIMLIDMDNHPERLENIRAQIPVDLEERVFILGTLSEPEDLKPDLGSSFDDVGVMLGRDIRDSTGRAWGHALLQINQPELDRLKTHLCPLISG
jgi:hypothetical protein